MPSFEEAGARLVAISPALPAHLEPLIQERKLAFDFLHDAGNAVASEYGLVFTLPEDLQKVYRGFGIDLAEANGDASWQLPMPARYVIDTDGIIRYARVHADYTRRPEPQETLDALRSLSNA